MSGSCLRGRETQLAGLLVQKMSDPTLLVHKHTTDPRKNTEKINSRTFFVIVTFYGGLFCKGGLQ